MKHHKEQTTSNRNDSVCEPLEEDRWKHVTQRKKQQPRTRFLQSNPDHSRVALMCLSNRFHRLSLENNMQIPRKEESSSVPRKEASSSVLMIGRKVAQASLWKKKVSVVDRRFNSQGKRISSMQTRY